MKHFALSLLLLSAATLAPAIAALPAGRPLTALVTTPTEGYLMVVSRVWLGSSPKASIVTVFPDGREQTDTERLKNIDLTHFTVKGVAQGLLEVDKAALTTVNQYQAEGWHLISVAPSTVVNAGNTMFTQTIYYLGK